ncbi:hypothetical protein PanWU01x14_124590 [Parasponia andersonii]|uniref:Uncharacterized protein n=1 Tax=Parasponia andersonii TaxID=3476 RepID=A0A2P5CTL5_PARAD|nr:hypothetical protein PanWU01x14_124590 [Parasponia andersonii]
MKFPFKFVNSSLSSSREAPGPPKKLKLCCPFPPVTHTGATYCQHTSPCTSLHPDEPPPPLLAARRSLSTELGAHERQATDDVFRGFSRHWLSFWLTAGKCTLGSSSSTNLDQLNTVPVSVLKTSSFLKLHRDIFLIIFAKYFCWP